MPTPTSRLIVVAITILTWLATPMISIACDTPVYRYAMYRWQPTPYEVYFLHEQDPGDSDVRVAELLDQASSSSEARANVIHLPVNLAKDPELNGVPRDIKDAWAAREDKSLPAYIVSTPYGVRLEADTLQADEVEAMLESPARKKLAAQLEAGKIGVVVLLTGSDTAANAQAERVLRELADDVEAGKLDLYEGPSELDVEGEEPKQSTPAQELGLLKVDRDSDEERWFVRSLLAVHAALDEREEPIAYLVYGRARALRPYVGEDITRDNLLREVEFVTGKCSCTVKEQNPGVDLLVRYDWESASAALAEKFGSEEGNESQFGPDMFFPELIIPAAESETAAELASNDNDEPSEPQATPEERDHLADASNELIADTPAPPADASPVPDNRSTEIASLPAAPGSPGAEEAPSSAFASVWVVGGAIAVGLVVLFGLTFIVLKPQ